jgi:tetratricopeptide (TPR) repeat protein
MRRIAVLLPILSAGVGASILTAVGALGAVAAGEPPVPAPIAAQGPAVVKARTAALLMSDMSGGDVRTSVLALPRGRLPRDAALGATTESGIEGRTRVWVKIEIDAAGLLGDLGDAALGRTGESGTAEEAGDDEVRDDEAGPIPVEVFAYGLSADNEVLDAFTVRFGLDASARRELRAGRGLAVAFTLELPPGDHHLRHLVWSDSARRGQRFGLGTTALRVPSSEPPPRLWIPERPGRWLWVSPAAGEPARGRPVWNRALEARAPADPVPASLPVLKAAEGTTGQVVAWWEVPGASPARGAGPQVPNGGTVRLEPEPTGAEPPVVEDVSGALFEEPFDVLESREGPGGGVLVQVGFPVPEIEPGRYLLTLRPEDGDDTLPLSVVVAGAEAGEVWPRVLPAVLEPGGSSPQGEPDRPPTEPESLESPKRTVAGSPFEDETAIRRVYREVIARLAGGDPEGAAADLVREEAEVLRGLEGAELEAALTRLTEVQRETAAAILGPEADGAPAMVLLHADAARQHFRAARWPLADRAVEQAVWLAEGHAAIHDTRQARRDAAGLLTWLAVDLRQAGRGTKAREMFRRSLALEETDVALLGLATLEERAGATPEAVAALERLVERDPAHREARLRLAVNLARLGRVEAAGELFRDLVRTADTSWVTALAFQELARIDLDRGDCSGAIRVLRRAREHFPHQTQLAVELAWALECAGRGAGSREVAARIVEQARRGETEGVCPRTRYTLWGEETLAPERRRLGELARQSRQSLKAVLGATGEGR